jgi:hypothetical protein
MVQEDRTCYHLAEILCSTNYTVIHHHPNAKFPDITEQPDRTDSEFDFSTTGIQNLMDRLLKNYLKWKGSLNQVMSHIQPKEAQQGSSTATGGIHSMQYHYKSLISTA